MSGLLQRSLTFFGVVALLCIVMVGDAVHARRTAEKLIEEIRNLDTAANPTAVSHSLMRKYSDRMIFRNCEFDSCQYQFLLTNGIVSKMQIVPIVEIKMYVNVFRGSLVSVGLDYTSAVFRADSPIVAVQEDFCADRTDIKCDHFELNAHGRNVTPTWNGIVEFGQLATEDQKRAAWALNLDCFTAIHGCKDISQLLPTIWKLTGPGTVSSRMRSSADSIAEASQPLPE